MKRLLLSLIAALITILGISAQNTYNMVIEMNDGTKINIGPNDIKNMTFTDGQLTLSGESIDDIKKEIADMKQKLDEQKSCECSKEIEALKQEIASLNTSNIGAIFNSLQMQIESLEKEISALKKNSKEDNNGGDNNNQGNNDEIDGNIPVSNYSNAIIGKWGYIHNYSKWGPNSDIMTRASDSGENEHDIKKDSNLYYELNFNNDGSLIIEHYYWDGTTDEEHLSYTISGNKLTITDGNNSRIYNILTFTNSTLIWEYEIVEDDYYEYNRNTFTRIE